MSDFLSALGDLPIELVPQASQAQSLVTARVDRQLEPAEVLALETGELAREVAEGDDLQRLRARHHMVARLLAQGIGESLVATMTGYTPGTISTLKSNPAMQELIAHYRAPVDQAAVLMGEKLRTLAGTASDELQKRLEETPEGIEDGTLVSIIKLGADRTGNGPTSTVNVKAQHIVATPDELRRLREEAAANERSLVKPAQRLLSGPAPEGEPK